MSKPDPERWADEVAHERHAATHGFPGGGGGGSSSGGGPNCLLTLAGLLAACLAAILATLAVLL